MGTQLQAHENMVAQWVAYGHIAVIGHGHQEEALFLSQREEQEDLETTASRRN